MIDVKERAAEKARRKMESAASGESERQKARRQLKDEINTYTGENVMLIAAAPEEAAAQKKLRTAAYCRVSTDDVGQVISIEMQKKEYRKKIRENPNWEYFGTYVDDGFSGTNTAHRPGFRKMMEDAMAGKIDAIITKSVSRFARNLLDCIGWVRRLQEHNPPIAVIFEDVNLNTLDQASSLILFVLAMVAEEESHMKSEAMQLSLEWRFASGRFLLPKLLGYESVKGQDGKKTLAVIPEEADTVRLMYFMLLNGSSPEEIAQTLTELGRPTGSGRTIWSPSGVVATLRNERYCGDVLGRKTWTPNFRDHKSKKNRGKKNRYYEPGHHEGIITRAQWNAAQKILNSRRYGHKAGYLPLRVVTKGALAGYVSVNRSWAGADADEYYRVSSIAMGLQEGDLCLDLENEHLPDGGYRIAGLSDGDGVQRIARELSEAEKAVKAEMEGEATQETDEVQPVPPGFQVAKAEMFSHAFEPVVRFYKRGILFNSTCVRKFDRHEGKPEASRSEYVEILFNPVERMLAVRECTRDHPNAVKWCTDKGTGREFGSTAFCRILYSLLGWEEGCSYRVPAIVRRKGDEQVLFFDLDNYIGTMPGTKQGQDADTAERPAPQEPEASVTGIFYAAEDDEPQKIEDLAALEERLRQVKENERKTFGVPAFEHEGDAHLPAIDDDGEWDILAEAVSVDTDHRVDEEIVAGLQLTMMEQMESGDDDEKEQEPGQEPAIVKEREAADEDGEGDGR